jgi:hypothetical protein
MNPNIRLILRGAIRVPKNNPRAEVMIQVRGIRVSKIAQLIVKLGCTPGAWITEAIGKTMSAAIRPWIDPATTLPIATRAIGKGASTRSSKPQLGFPGT